VLRRKVAVAWRSGEGLFTMLCGPSSMQIGRVHDLRPGKPSEGELDGGEGNEGG
jgi:hypothetical protein